MTTNEPARQNIQIRDELRRYNRTLKEIGKLCGLSVPLISYVSRHTYATHGNKIGVPVEIISEALGHSSVEVTQTYLDSFEQSKVDEMHMKIVGI